MTLVTQGKASRKRSVWGHNTGTTTEDVYTCPANCSAELVYLIVNNNSISVKWYDTSETYASSFVEGKSLGGGDFLEFQGIELVLEPGDKIQITPSSAGHIDSIVTVVETFVPVG
jgi:hypothetical protein